MDKIKEFIQEKDEALKELKSKKWYRQITNMFTASRLLAPIVVLGLSLFSTINSCIIALTAFALTDCIDGFIARTFKLKSDFGAKLDALADKIFAGTIMIPLIPTYPILLVNFIIEGKIGFTNLLSYLKDNDPKSTKLGKLKTVLLFASLVAGYLSVFVNFSNIITYSLIGGAIGTGIAASIDYTRIDKEKDLKKEIKPIETKEEVLDEDNKKQELGK